MAVVCPICGHECDQTWRCCECGKIFDGGEDETDTEVRSLHADGAGGVDARSYYQGVDSQRQLAGVADQDPTCENGTRGCPGPDSGTLPCFDCLVDGGDDAT